LDVSCWISCDWMLPGWQGSMPTRRYRPLWLCLLPE